MTAFMWQVFDVMTLARFLPFPFLLSLFYLVRLVRLVRPWPWGWLLAPGIPSLLLFADWMTANDRCRPGGRVRCSSPFPLWEELPAWTVAGVVATSLFYLILFGLTYGVRRLGGLPGRWRYEPADLPQVDWYFIWAAVGVLAMILFLIGPALEAISTFVIAPALIWLLD